MSKRRDISLYIQDMKEAAEAIFTYVEDLSFSDFVNDRKTYSAVIREFEIIGEAAKHLPEELTNTYGYIAWRDIIDFRNLLIHEYFGVDSEIVWNTIRNDLPILYQTLCDMEKDN